MGVAWGVVGGLSQGFSSSTMQRRPTNQPTTNQPPTTDRQDAIVRLDMSEYMERHTVSKLIGAPRECLD